MTLHPDTSYIHIYVDTKDRGIGAIEIRKYDGDTRYEIHFGGSYSFATAFVDPEQAQEVVNQFAELGIVAQVAKRSQ